MMTLNNGATDGEPDSHTVILGGVERFEEPVRSLRVEPDSRILHRQPYMIVFVPFSFNQQLPRTIVDRAHRVGCIPDQVQDDLLQLDTIASDDREVLGKLRPQDHPTSLKFAR